MSDSHENKSDDALNLIDNNVALNSFKVVRYVSDVNKGIKSTEIVSLCNEVQDHV